MPKFIEHLPFETKRVVGEKARIGLVVLASDWTIEHEFRSVLADPAIPDGVDIFVSRIANAANVTPETLAAMGPTVTETAARLLPGGTFDVLAYGCTSASMVLGPEAVSEQLKAAKPEAATTNPASAAFAAFEALSTNKIAVLTPYRRDVNEFILAGFEGAGLTVTAFGSFNEEVDATVAAIDTNSVRSGIARVLQEGPAEAVFVSCTSIRLLHALKDLEAEFGVPIMSSNQAMIWHCLRLAGVDEKLGDFGNLFVQSQPVSRV